MSNNKANMLLQWGIIYRSTNWDWTTYAEWTGANEAATLAALAAWTYEDVGLFTDASIMHTQEDTKTILTDYCNIWEVKTSTVLTPRLEFTWQEIWDISIFASMLWLLTLSVAWTPVTITAEAHWTWWTKWTPFKLTNKMWANTVVSSIVVKSWGTPVVLNTDYWVYVWDWIDGLYWYTYITPLLANAWVITVDYSYTPSASKQLNYTANARTVPYQLFKLVTCANSAWQSDTYYLAKWRVASEMQLEFINEKRTDFKWSKVTIQWAAWSNFFWKKETLTAIA